MTNLFLISPYVAIVYLNKIDDMIKWQIIIAAEDMMEKTYPLYREIAENKNPLIFRYSYKEKGSIEGEANYHFFDEKTLGKYLLEEIKKNLEVEEDKILVMYREVTSNFSKLEVT